MSFHKNEPCCCCTLHRRESVPRADPARDVLAQALQLPQSHTCPGLVQFPCISLQLGTLSARALGAACGGPRTLRLSAEEAHDRVVDMDVIALALLLEDVDGTHGWAKNVEAGLELADDARDDLANVDADADVEW